MRALKSLLLYITLSLTWTDGFARYYEEPVMYPQFNRISFEGNTVILGDDIRIKDSEFVNWPNIKINKQIASQIWKYRQSADCPLPPEAEKQIPAKHKPVQVLLCTTKRIWLVKEGYCPEGGPRQAQVYSYETESKRLTHHRNYLPRCETSSDAVQVGDELWIASIRPIEKYETMEGSGILVYRPEENVRLMDRPAESSLHGEVIHAMAHNAQTNQVWVTTQTGIHRYDLMSNRWQHRFYHFYVSADNELRVALKKQAQQENRLPFYSHFYYLPIQDKLGFEKTWLEISQEENFPLLTSVFGFVVHERLLPYYIASALQFVSPAGKAKFDADHGFGRLLVVIREHDPLTNKPRFIELAKQLLVNQNSLEPRQSIARFMKWLEMDTKALEEQLAFDRVAEKHRKYPQYLRFNFKLCDWVKERPMYLPQLSQLLRDIKPAKQLDIEHCLTGKGGRKLPPPVRHKAPMVRKIGPYEIFLEIDGGDPPPLPPVPK